MLAILKKKIFNLKFKRYIEKLSCLMLQSKKASDFYLYNQLYNFTMFTTSLKNEKINRKSTLLQ
jgi:hypothetical protein